WSAKRSNRTTGDLMRTDPRGFPSWPEAVTASLRGRIHYRGRFLTDDGSLRIRGGPYIFAEDDRLNVYAGELKVRPPRAPTTRRCFSACGREGETRPPRRRGPLRATARDALEFFGRRLLSLVAQRDNRIDGRGPPRGHIARDDGDQRQEDDDPAKAHRIGWCHVVE